MLSLYNIKGDCSWDSESAVSGVQLEIYTAPGYSQYVFYLKVSWQVNRVLRYVLFFAVVVTCFIIKYITHDFSEPKKEKKKKKIPFVLNI